MIVSAAVKIYEEKLDKEITIPCHRHSDAFRILKEFGYEPHKGYKELAQGFLDEHGNFLNRTEAYYHAVACLQIPPSISEYSKILISEDLW